MVRQEYVQVALVTGAARGIGLATTECLLRRDWRVVAFDLLEPVLGLPGPSSDALDALERAFPNSLIICKGDVREPLEISDAVARARTSFDRLDAAVACAGVISGNAVSWEPNPEADRTVFETNYLGVKHLAEQAIPAILSSGGFGRLVAISSAAGSKPLPRLANYVATKHAVEGYVRSIALELAGTGVTANCVAPGSTASEILEESARIYGLTSSTTFADQHITGRIIMPVEIARAVCFLLEEASSSITGSVLRIDGGLTLT